MLSELPQRTGGLENRDLLCHHSSLNTYPARRLAAAGWVSDECLRRKLVRNSTVANSGKPHSSIHVQHSIGDSIIRPWTSAVFPRL